MNIKCNDCIWMGLMDVKGSIFDLSLEGTSASVTKARDAIAVCKGDAVCLEHLHDRLKKFIGRRVDVK